MTSVPADNQYFYVQPADVDSAGGFLWLRGEEAYHCSRALRKSAGDVCYAVDGTGHEFLIRILDVGRDEIRCAIQARSFRERELPFRITIAAALIKPDRYEWMLEKCTELGAGRFIPVKTERSHAEPGINRMTRWKKILLSAMKQSRRSVCPVLADPIAFESVIRLDHTGQRLFFHETAVHSLNQRLDGTAGSTAGDTCLLIGPEGGFTETEFLAARDAGWTALSLGARRLRAETAAVSACSIFSILQSALSPS